MKKIAYLICTLSLLLAGANSSFGQENLEVSRGEEQSKTIEITQMAADLVSYGQKNEDPYSLVAAAKMLLEFKAEDADASRVDAGEGKTEAPDQATEGEGLDPVELNATSILALASSFADKNSNIMRAIEDLQKQAKSGARGYAYGKGYIKGYYTVPSYGYRDFKWTFNGRELAEILFKGDGDTNIDVYVYDGSGRLLGKDTSYSDRAYFSWIPPYKKQYTFRVVNRGRYTNTVFVISN